MQDELILEQAADEINDVKLEEANVFAEEEIIETLVNLESPTIIAEEAQIIEMDVSEGFTGNISLNVAKSIGGRTKAADDARYE